MELGVHLIDFLPGDPKSSLPPWPQRPRPPNSPARRCSPWPITSSRWKLAGGRRTRSWRDKIEVLNRHCDDVGRDPATIRKTAGLFIDPFSGDSDGDAFFRTAEKFAALGFDLANVGPYPGDPDPVGYAQRLGDEVVPRLAELG